VIALLRYQTASLFRVTSVDISADLLRAADLGGRGRHGQAGGVSAATGPARAQLATLLTALGGGGAAIQSAAWPAGVPLAAAFALVVASWTASCWLASHRAE
jgi:hypothetical protein